jgi:AcrR family transcriptional regulator
MVPVQPAFRRLPRAVREQQILDAAVSVFSHRGYHDTSVDEIAERAEISKPMVYAYVGTKEQLFIACLHREGVRLMEAIAAAALAGPTRAEQRLAHGLRAFLRFVAAHRDGWSVLYRQARGQEPFAAVIGQLRAQMAEVVSGSLARVVAEAGQAMRESDVQTMGYALVGAAEALADWIVDHPSEDPDAIADRLMTVIWLGAAAALRGESWPG